MHKQRFQGPSNGPIPDVHGTRENNMDKTYEMTGANVLNVSSSALFLLFHNLSPAQKMSSFEIERAV